MGTVRWGILGTGNIARQFARGLELVDEAQLVAVGSRSQETANAFADEFGTSRRYGSYAELAACSEIDAIYISTPHVLHKENTLLCLDHDKAVLCEKPFAINAREAGDMVRRARDRGCFLMEAMWTHFFPAMERVRQLIADGAIGEVRMVKADFCFRAGWDPVSRLLNPMLGGGGLLDVGVYAVSFAQMVMGGEPTAVTGAATIGDTQVDEQCGLVLSYESGALAILTSAVRTQTLHDAWIYGTDGWIRIPHCFWKPERLVVKRGEEEEEIRFGNRGVGYCYEAEAVGQCLRDGLLEHPLMPHSKTLAVMRTLDAARAQWGLQYPCESRKATV